MEFNDRRVNQAGTYVRYDPAQHGSPEQNRANFEAMKQAHRSVGHPDPVFNADRRYDPPRGPVNRRAAKPGKPATAVRMKFNTRS